MPRINGNWTDTMQVCSNGHIVTSRAVSHPEEKRDFCQDCGAFTMTNCSNCSAPIPGYEHIVGLAHGGPTTPPKYCGKCGLPFPWTTPKADEGKRSSTSLSNKVFVVHGHDEAVKLDVARTLETLGLEPIILHEQASRGMTVIEKIQAYSNVGFAVVILTPDDSGFAKKMGESAKQDRARQNVILELGYFIGLLGRDKVMALVREPLETPSDFSGVVYTSYDGGWKNSLVQELRSAGYEVSADKLIKL